MDKTISKSLRLIFRGVIPKHYERPAEWAARSIRFTHEKDPIQGPLDLSLTPYLIDPINAWELEKGQGLKEVTVVAPEQTGKSLSWQCGELWSLENSPGLSLIYYTSQPKAERVNEEKMEPMMRAIPRFAELLDLPNSRTADCYRLGESLSYFGGVGSRISSFSARRCVADELDDWQEKGNVNALDDLRKRSRAFPESLVYAVCTPKGTDTRSRIWREFMKSSQGYWHLRCVHCGELTIRSCDVHRLQFEIDHDEIVPGSCRMICPKCGFEHLEAQKEAMIREGGYVHKFPEKKKSHPGFQWGAMASPFKSFAWEKIAAAQLHAGKTGDIIEQIYFDNSIRGRPFRPRQLDSNGEAALKRHGAPDPEKEKIRFRFLAVDTQDEGFFWVVRGMDLRSNSYFLSCGKAIDLVELARVWETDYAGGKCLCGILDEGGHRTEEVRNFVRERPGLWTYKGNTHIGSPWKQSKEVKHLILANADYFRLILLHHLYATENKGDHYWFLPVELPEAYKEQMTSWQPNSAIRNGNALENYHCPSGNDHFFDCEKMMLVLIDFFKREVLPKLVSVPKIVKRV